ASKSGVRPEEVSALLALADVRGLSTMPPAAADPEASRDAFRRLRELARRHGLPELSMGTSQDYRVAADEGATFVRIGSSLLRSFNDAQQIADRFKQSTPVILNLQNADTELSKRLIDFASGLTYALEGGMQRVADKVFLLTPRDVEVSAEERARLLDAGAFFNQA